MAMLERETKAWNGEANRKRTKINWRYTRKKARKDFKYEPPPRSAKITSPSNYESNREFQESDKPH